jgi:hypothetical protein
MERAVNLRSTAEMVTISTSRASAANERRARKHLEKMAQEHGTKDPEEVTAASSNFVLNILYSHMGMDGGEGSSLLGKDSMAALIQGLQMIYDRAGHTSNWHVGSDGSASGNPLRGNVDVARLRKKHRAKLADVGRTSKRATPINEEHICRHFSLILDVVSESGERIQDAKAWALHAIWVVGLHCGLRFDELSKLQFSGISFGEHIRLTLPLKTKNSITHKDYDFIEWNSPILATSHAMDPTVALCSWLSVRGDGTGYIFCNIASSGRLDYSRPWDPKCFIEYMRERLHLVGEGEANVGNFSSHSIKRGAVQLYRKIHMTDHWIMRRIKMVGEYAYLRYTEEFNDVAPQEVPQFANVDAARGWAQTSPEITIDDALDDEEDDARV